MTPVIAYSTVVLAIVFLGVAFRRRRRVHIPIMLTAFALDLASVVYLQVQRRAVQKATAEPAAILIVHVALAIGTLVFYAVMTATGTRLARTGNGRATHRRMAGVFLFCRIGTWATSFFVM